MSRSRKKRAIVWLTKRWNKCKESAFRCKVRNALHEIEVDFDPDRDWEEANIGHKKAAAEMGTRCGYDVKPHPDDSQTDLNSYENLLRK